MTTKSLIVHALGGLTATEVQSKIDAAIRAFASLATLSGVPIEAMREQAAKRLEETVSSVQEHAELVDYLEAQTLIAKQNLAAAELVKANAQAMVDALPAPGYAVDLVPVTPFKAHLRIADEAVEEVK